MIKRIWKKIVSLFTKNARHKFMLVPVKVTLIYFIASFLWILFSDRLANRLINGKELLTAVNTYKGWIYVAVISAVLFWTLKRAFERVEMTESKLIESYEELTATHEELEAANEELCASEEELKEKYIELKASENRLKRAQAIAHVGNWELDVSDWTMWASEEAFRIYGIAYDSPYLPLTLVQSVVHPDDRSRLNTALKRLISENDKYDIEFRIQRVDDQQERIMHSVAEVEYDEGGRPKKVLGVIRDITDSKENETRIYTMAYRDVLTGLPNRLKLEETVKEVVSGSTSNIALLFIDLDDFKYINDTFGHLLGDDVLKVMAQRLLSVIDNKDFLFRLGGDEFAILLMDTGKQEIFKEHVKRILNSMKIDFCIKNIQVQITASIGVAYYPEHGSDFEELMKNADTAMYEAKNLGKNCYTVFDHSMNALLYEKVRMESNLRNAVINNEFVLYYQPLYSLSSGTIFGLEALVRWNSPIYGLVPPGDFIPFAEETGLIIHIGKWVLKAACEYINKLRRIGLGDITVSVNISVRQLAQDNFVESVLEAIDETGIDTARLQLEITESVLMENIGSNLKKIDLLKEHGISIALDDFGSGYSSLTYLKRLPISTLKVEKTFIDEIESDPTKSDIAKAIIMLAHTLKLKVVAEGVETKAQLDCLAAYDCDLIQGYYISQPLPEEAVEGFFATFK